jgi:hypothetical protein
MIDNFQFRVGPKGKLEINLNLWGHFNMLYGQFQIGVENIGDNIAAIVMPGDPLAQDEARRKYAGVLRLVRRYLEPRLLQKGFSRCELGPNEAIARFQAIRATLDSARGDQRLQATESTFIHSGFTGLLNDLLGTGQTVDKVIISASQLTDEELMRMICEDINLRAIRAARG